MKPPTRTRKPPTKFQAFDQGAGDKHVPGWIRTEKSRMKVKGRKRREEASQKKKQSD